MIAIVLGLLGAVLCGVIASQKNREVAGWVVFGLFLPIVALIWLACLKTKITWSKNPELLNLPCPHCGKNISGSSDFCPQCGTKIIKR